MKTSDIIPTVKPHTIKKFELIEKYVDEWSRKILGYNGINGHPGSQGVIYIDCMSSSGINKDVDGNLIEGTALRVARRLNEIIPNYKGKEAILIFNDYDTERIQYLEEKIKGEDLTNIKVYYQNKDCNLFLKNIDINKFQDQYNTLLFYDPYKADIDWDAVTPFLNRWGEVIINHMVYDTSRGVTQAKKTDVIKRYQKTYQKDIESIIKMGNNKEELNKVIMQIIGSRNKEGTSEMYIASFPFFNRTNGLIYNLIHCCHNIEGIKLFKKVAWKTFGNKSSTKNIHDGKDQMVLDFDNKNPYRNPTDEDCYQIRDVAQYIYDKYNAIGDVSIQTIYDDLDMHPIFPCDGYRRDIKNELKKYGVVFRINGEVDFSKR